MDNKLMQAVKAIIGASNIDEGGIAYPQKVEEIMELIKLANKEGFKVYPIGSGSKFYSINPSTDKGLIISLTKLNKIVEYRPNNMSIEVEAGVTTGQLLELLAKDNIFYPIDTMDSDSTIGGQVAANKYGRKQYMYKSTRFHVLGVEFVSPQGQLVVVGGKTVKNVSGSDITQMLVGSWGAFGIITKVILRVRPIPEKNINLVLEVESKDRLKENIDIILKEKLNLAAMTFVKEENKYTLHVELEGFQSSLDGQKKLLCSQYGYQESPGDLLPPKALEGEIAIPLAKYNQVLDEIESLLAGASGSLMGNVTNGTIALNVSPQKAETISSIVQKYNGAFIYQDKVVTSPLRSPGYTTLLNSIKKQVDPNNILFPEILS